MKGFFSPSQLAQFKEPPNLYAKCGLCKLYKTCNSPRMEPSGKGKSGVLIVGEAPGANEDRDGVQFTGKTGQLLESVLASIDVKMRRDCRITNALACRPPNNIIPKLKMVDWCRPKVLKVIDDFNPRVIIPLGSKAIKSILGPYWKDANVGGALRWAGYQIPLRKPNVWVCPTYHPSFVDREKADAALYRKVFTAHLKAAFALEARPWPEVPDYEGQVDLLYSPEAACEAIRAVVKAGRPTAFDYETDRLKPEHERSTILAASMCHGARAFAFPMCVQTHRVFKEFLRSKVPKISHNLKFEERWSRRFFGTRVRAWCWDTMTTAHALNSRQGATSLKFQALVNFGQEDYSSHLDKLMHAGSGGSGQNDIRDVDKKSLLLYCGLDSLHTLELARLQAKELDCNVTDFQK